MRIAIIRQRYTPFGGAERFVERALAALAAEGADITLIARHWAGARESGEAGGGYRRVLLDPPYARLLGGRVARDRSFALAAAAEMASGRYDITQAHERIPGCTIFRAGDGVHAAWLDHRGRTQPAWRRATARLAPYHRYILAQERALLAHPALRAVICNSELVADEMRRYHGVADDKLLLIENGVDLDRFHPRLAEEWRERQRAALGIPQAAPVFVHVGSGFERKGVPRLLAALRAARCGEAHLVIVGRDRQLKALQARAAALGLAPRVHFTGPQTDVRPFLGMADAFVLPTLYDPQPNAALEALASGLPVLTSTSCGIAARIRAGENGYVDDALDIPALASHLEALAEPGAAARMRAAARAAVSDLDLGTMAGRLTALYRRLAGSD